MRPAEILFVPVLAFFSLQPLARAEDESCEARSTGIVDTVCGLADAIYPGLCGTTAVPAAPPPPTRTCSLSSFGITTNSTLTNDQLCVIFDDLTYLGQMSFSDQRVHFTDYYGTAGLSGPQIGARLVSWLRARITSLVRGPVEGALAANLGHARRAGHDTQDLPSQHGSIILTDAFFRENRMKRLGVYIHEARHSDGDRHIAEGTVDDAHPSTSHGHCRTVSLGGGGGSSSTVSDFGCDPEVTGAYGYEAVFYNNISRACANCSSDDRDEARRIGMSALLNHHNEIPEDLMTELMSR